MIQKEIVTQLVNNLLVDSDYFLVDVTVSTANAIVVEIDNEEGVDIDFCAKLSKSIEAVLDREVEDYELEVGSAGLTTPFKVIQQYQKNIGNEVEVLAKDGRKFTGILTAVDEINFTIEVEKMVKLEGAKRKSLQVEQLSFAYNDVKHTKYIIKFK